MAVAAPSLLFSVGFQLLQYEIVLFDPVDALSIAQTAAHGEQDTLNSYNGGDIAMKLQHGKSCLFEANADHLAIDLHIPIELHAGLLRKATQTGNEYETVSLQTEMRFRVCEWASSSGTWGLKDHANRVVGSATGVVTLSCLGQALAPHLVHAIGLQVDKCVQSRSTSPTRSRSESMEKVAPATLGEHADAESTVGDQYHQQRIGSAKAKDTGMDTSKTCATDKQENAMCGSQTVETAVQCDEDHLYVNGDDKASFAHRSASPMIRIEGKKSNPKVSSSDRVVRQTHPTAMHDEHKRHHSSNVRHSREAPTRNVFTRDLPPPLFFQKPKSKKT
ncbi:Thioredoxin-dependent peroxide reductase, partial [Globisporangium splendens]